MYLKIYVNSSSLEQKDEWDTYRSESRMGYYDCAWAWQCRIALPVNGTMSFWMFAEDERHTKDASTMPEAHQRHRTLVKYVGQRVLRESLGDGGGRGGRSTSRRARSGCPYMGLPAQRPPLLPIRATRLAVDRGQAGQGFRVGPTGLREACQF